MKLQEFPKEIQSLIFKHLYPTDLVKIWHEIPELRYLITPDTLKIVTDSKYEISNLKYSFPDDFYAIEPINPKYIGRSFRIWKGLEVGEEEELERDPTDYELFDISKFENFKGAILLEHFYGGSEYHYRYFGLYYMLKNNPLEVIYHCDALSEDLIESLEFSGKKAGPNLKSISWIDPYNIKGSSFIPSIKLPPGLFQVPGVKETTVYYDKSSDDHYFAKLLDTAPELEKITVKCEKDLYEERFIYPSNYNPFKHTGGYNYNPWWSSDSEDDDGVVTVEESTKYFFTQFLDTKLAPLGSLDFLKHLKITSFKNEKVNFEKWTNLPNLETLEIFNCTIHSISHLDLPNLKTLEIVETALLELSNLKLDSLETFITHLVPCPHIEVDMEGGEYQDEEDEFPFTMKNIEFNRLEKLDFDCELKVEELSNLSFPMAKSIRLNCYPFYQPFTYSHPEDAGEVLKFSDNVESLELINCSEVLTNTGSFSNVTNLKITNITKPDDYFEPTIDTSFPKLNTLFVKNISFGNLNLLLNKTSEFQDIQIIDTPGFKAEQISLQKQLKSLFVQSRSLGSFDELELPSLESLKLIYDGDKEIVVQECSFDNLKSLTIKNGEYRSYTGQLVFRGNDAPKLETLKLSGLRIMNSISTDEFPLLKSVVIDRIESLEISSSEILEMIDLSKNFNDMKLEMNGSFPNLKEYKEAKKHKQLESPKKKIRQGRWNQWVREQ
ncbi:Internalin-I [Wickerhamomyces ciferrii]|uniref:Internalin-I n=1 Tax=Wickerhamomyces ciferrii (strain ATCC 14091 / BCRC 22168 / CBS 111 / JCM 3599 / NBRC 0793 / NRRL Y-1031 F-60-10) TaxID=1206466 RepID=K0KJ84_WICCF|nr:Internalin-I [Wickerhamomyces ciferrii]CCH41173.1 Internalin-I [Wickerhamomyces ciferrii]